MRNSGLSIAIVISILAFGVLIWPGMYHYVDPTENNAYPIRINRITGEAQILAPEGWKVIGQQK